MVRASNRPYGPTVSEPFPSDTLCACAKPEMMTWACCTAAPAALMMARSPAPGTVCSDQLSGSSQLLPSPKPTHQRIAGRQRSSSLSRLSRTRFAVCVHDSLPWRERSTSQSGDANAPPAQCQAGGVPRRSRMRRQSAPQVLATSRRVLIRFICLAKCQCRAKRRSPTLKRSSRRRLGLQEVRIRGVPLSPAGSVRSGRRG